jgi:hypothetical protein
VALAVVSTIGKVHAHDIYSGFKQPHTGKSCCADRDCAPAKEDIISNADGSYELPARGITVPKSRVIPSPDDRYHICAPENFPQDVICLLVPLLS